jgi:hypothetical protein
MRASTLGLLVTAILLRERHLLFDQGAAPLRTLIAAESGGWARTVSNLRVGLEHMQRVLLVGLGLLVWLFPVPSPLSCAGAGFAMGLMGAGLTRYEPDVWMAGRLGARWQALSQA